MEWGILFVLLVLIVVAYVIVQETRAQLHWRGLVQQGDVQAIRRLTEEEIERWHRERVPKGVPALLWHGVQTVELLDVGATAARVSCTADGEYSLIDGRRVETSSPLDEGKKITMKLAEMLLYDVPNVKLDRVQIDVYTSFRDQSGLARTECILSTLVRRPLVEHIDWEELPAHEFVELNQGRFAANGSLALRPVEPIMWTDGGGSE
jgi:hypothetical protein